MLWFWKKRGIRVLVNNTINLRDPSPGFTDSFVREARRQGRKVDYWRRGKADIVLLIGKTKFKDKMEHFRRQGAKFVQRIDGIGVEDQEHPEKNNYNYETYQKTDAVIFQSRFCQQAWQEFFGSTKPYTIILNGADELVFSREGEKEDFGFKRFIVTAARWREWKNLKQTIELFEALDDRELGLVVIGEDAQVPRHPRIVATGRLNHKQMARVFRAAEFFVYLPWFEWCPKVVAQALVAGLPVLCSYKGGTRELVDDCGMVVKGEKDHDLRHLGPNPVNLEQAVNAANTILQKRERIRTRPDLYLSKMVENYYAFFQKVLDNAL